MIGSTVLRAQDEASLFVMCQVRSTFALFPYDQGDTVGSKTNLRLILYRLRNRGHSRSCDRSGTLDEKRDPVAQ